MPSKAAVWAIIPAAGSGNRMHSDIPKQYLSFQGKTILEHCLDRLLSHPDIDGAVLVLQAEDQRWDQLGYLPSKPLFTTNGGSERQDSVYSGLTTLQYRCGFISIRGVRRIRGCHRAHENGVRTRRFPSRLRVPSRHGGSGKKLKLKT